MNVIAKIFCGILAERLDKWVTQRDILSNLQAGFRKNYSTIEHIFTLSSIVKAFQARNKKVYSFFVDFKAAFDLVNRNALFYKLSQLGISSKFINVIKEMYTETKAAVWDGSAYSKWFVTSTGVKQGCLLSALLFSLFINDVVDDLPGGINIASSTINVLLYADDLVLLSESPENLQLMINRLASYCNKWGLTINTAKSKVMIFSRSVQSQTRNRWFYNGNLLEISKEIKYLGVKLNSTLDFNKHLLEKVNTSQSLLNSTWKKVFSNDRIQLSAKYKIFDAVVKSTLCYASQVWGSEEYEVIEKFQRNFLKKLFNLPLNTPSYAIYLETGLPQLMTNTLKAQADFIIKICAFQNSRISKKMLLYELRNKDWWFAKWQYIGSSCGEMLRMDINNLCNVKDQLYKIIQKNEDSIRDAFIIKACESDSRFLYSQLDFNLNNRNYFNDSLSYKEISLIFKARSETLSLNGSPYNGSFNQFCTLCNLKSKEDCFHVISICPIFKQQRIHFFGKQTLTMQETLQILNGCDWKMLSNFLSAIYKYRMLLITEYV